MGKSLKKVLREEYNRLKKVMKKIINPAKEEAIPQLALLPLPDKKYLRGNLR